jgi:hypothetical protein
VAAAWRKFGNCKPLPKNEPEREGFAAKKSQLRAAARDRHLNAGIPAHFGDNAFNGIVVFGA